jgi:uncharacterized phage-associated protein
MRSARDVAQYFLVLAHTKGGSEPITNLKLQKLLYYAQGFYIALYDRPLFSDDLEAWTYGPVVPDVYHQYKCYGSGVIPAPEQFDAMTYDPGTQSFLNAIYARYGDLSATTLLEMTHQESPWRDAMLSRMNMCGGFITVKAMKAFFGNLLTPGSQGGMRMNDTRSSAPPRDQPDASHVRPEVMANVKQSLKDNAAVWAELAKY